MSTKWLHLIAFAYQSIFKNTSPRRGIKAKNIILPHKPVFETGITIKWNLHFGFKKVPREWNATSIWSMRKFLKIEMVLAFDKEDTFGKKKRELNGCVLLEEDFKQTIRDWHFNHNKRDHKIIETENSNTTTSYYINSILHNLLTHPKPYYNNSLPPHPCPDAKHAILMTFKYQYVNSWHIDIHAGATVYSPGSAVRTPSASYQTVSGTAYWNKN